MRAVVGGSEERRAVDAETRRVERRMLGEMFLRSWSFYFVTGGGDMCGCEASVRGGSIVSWRCIAVSSWQTWVLDGK